MNGIKGYVGVEIEGYTNPTTGAEYPPRVVFRTSGKLINLSPQREMNVNSNGKPFRLATIEVPSLTGHGTDIKTAMCYEKNYDPSLRDDESTHEIEKGEPYLATMSIDDEGRLNYQLSHLHYGGERDNISDADTARAIKALYAAQDFDMPEDIAVTVQKTLKKAETETVPQEEGQPS